MAIDSWLAAEIQRDGAWVHLGTSMTQLTQAWCGLHRLAAAAFRGGADSPPDALTDRTRAAAAEYFDDAAPAPHWIMLPDLRRVLDCVDPAAPPTDAALAAASEHFADPEHTECLGDVRQMVAMLELGDDDPDESAIRILAWWGY